MILKDQVALVTGAAQGLGKAIALALAQEGANVVVADINGEGAETTSNEVAALGRKSLALQVDVGVLENIDRMVRQAIETFGHIDILVNNAGVTRRAYIMDVTEELWDRIFRINTKGVFFCLQRVAKEMIPRRRGVIINMASIAGKGFVGTTNAAYAASKGAVITLTKTAAQQLARHNINVNAICPGTTLTSLVEANLRDRAKEENRDLEEMRRIRNQGIPLGRPNEPEDISSLAVYLASPAARNITGQSINVDGGMIMD